MHPFTLNEALKFITIDKIMYETRVKAASKTHYRCFSERFNDRIHMTMVAFLFSQSDNFLQSDK